MKTKLTFPHDVKEGIYFLSQDGDGHWYVIPESKEREWREWQCEDAV